MPQQPAGIITFLFTDVERSTQLWEQHPEAMPTALARHDASLRAAIEAHHGQVFKTMGDAFCAAFAHAADALRAAVAVQQNLQSSVGAPGYPRSGRVPAAGGWGALPASVGAPLVGALPAGEADEGHPREGEVGEGHPRGVPLQVRIALHTGTAEARGGDYFGPTLNRIARLLAIGHGGQVLLSRTTYDLVQHELPPGAAMRNLGLHRLRDLELPEHVYQLLHPDLRAEFPLLRSLRFLSHNLPQPTTRFVGREQEIGQIRQLLANTRLLTLTGTGGTGKTRLALHVAGDLLRAYEDGVWLVELAALGDPGQLPQAVATALELREEEGKTLADTLVEYLEPKHLLLILDNCEHLLTACAGLVDRLLQYCPHVRVLTTSRERLNVPGEQIYRVPSLSAPHPQEWPPSLEGRALVSLVAGFDAVQMFLDRAALVRSSFTLTPANAAVVAQVCHELDGIPLAIELAAARLQFLSVQQVARLLDDRFRWLTGGSRAAPTRQQTLRALIDWSYDLLTEPEQALLQRLSVFAGSFTLEAVAAVCSDSGFEVMDLLGRLVDQSLVLVDELEEGEGTGVGRYRLLETIRQYGSRNLWEAGDGANLRWRYREWLLAICEQAVTTLSGLEEEGWRQWLAQEHDHLHAALGPAARAHPSGAASGERADLPLGSSRLARWGRVVEGLVPVYRRLSRGEAARGMLEDYAGLCEAEGDARALARAHTLMALFLRLNPHQSERETSRSMFERAIAVCEKAGLDDWIAYPRARLAHDLAFDGVDLEQAEALARACPPEADAREDIQWMASGGETLAPTIYGALMWVATHRGDWEALKKAFTGSLPWGGPAGTPLLEMLNQIEETCHRQNAGATFRDLCQFMAEGYAGTHLEPPFQQWYLAPAAPRSLPGEPWLKEEFSAADWHSSLRWRDATGRSRVERAARPGWLGLYPAEGCDLWPPKDLNAPRLMASVQGDFVAQTRVELGAGARVLAGLLIWRDARHFARLELQSRQPGWNRVEPVLEACVDGRFRQIGRGQCARQVLWLRLERVGEELRGLCSEDGRQWLACGHVRFPPGAGEEVGLAAVAHGPGGHAWFNTFLLWRWVGGAS